MTDKLKEISLELQTGISIEKCRKCGCMKGTLEEMRDRLESSQDPDAATLKAKVKAWIGSTEESLYT